MPPIAPSLLPTIVGAYRTLIFMMRKKTSIVVKEFITVENI
jgi:hypothetical protein